jgi:hypothetical protein
MSKSRPEHELVICIARPKLDQNVRESIQALLYQPIDWHYLRQTALTHGLLPLLYFHLADTIAAIVPSESLSELKNAFFENGRRNLDLLRQLRKVTNLLSTSGVRTLAFKGPLLAKTVYGDAALRMIADLDILVAQRDFTATKEILEDAGYKMTPQLSERQQVAHLNHHCEIQFYSETTGTIIDLHWSLAPSNFVFNIDIDECFRHSKKLSLGGQEIETLNEEDLLLYLCMHGAKHYWTRLEWIASVSAMIKIMEDTDWTRLVERAKRYETWAMFSLAVFLAKEILDLFIPTQLYQLLDTRPSLNGLVTEYRERLFGPNSENASQWEMFRMNLRFMDSRIQAVQAL